MDLTALQLSNFTGSLTDEERDRFQAHVYEIYRQYRRSFAWRETRDPYHILVSEVMLQQTQVSRVVEKYEQFIAAFPTIYDLACAELREVLSVWVGLGYNRRGAALHTSAQIIVQQFDGHVPCGAEFLGTLPGIGPNTTGSIQAFAFNYPSVFIETNIRSVMIYTWFHEHDAVADKQLIPLIAQTLDTDNPREWYYALMDYGVLLKRAVKNPSRKSFHYVKQSKFLGSDRQLRGAIIRHLTQQERSSWEELRVILADPEERIQVIIDQLCRERLVRKTDDGGFTMHGL
jgi:A/G-specific adenine glycosylase